jgi:2-methylcitrate dehydratase PrpD
MNIARDDVSVGASRILANHVAGIRYANLQPPVVHAFRRAFLDFLTCAIAGSAMPVSRSLMTYFEETDATRVSSVIGTPLKLSAQNAAFVNGANVHGLDFDDGFTQGSCHPAGPVFSAVMAAAQPARASDQDIVAAAVAGYDVMCRMAAAMHPASARRGYHNTALAGVFGATAAVCNLYKLDAAQTLHAFGLAGSFSAGIREYLDEGAEIKRIHPGKAARDGLLCADLGKRGITGPSKILEGRYGFFATHVDVAAGEVKWPRLFDALGQRYEITGIYFKPYPCCRHYHACIDGIKELRDQHGFAAQDVEHVQMGIYAVGVHGHDHKHADSLLDAQMSAPCAAAIALTCGDVTARNYMPEVLDRPDVRAMIDRCDAAIDDECERIYPGTRSGFVRISLRGGKSVEKRVVSPRGEKENPMSDADLIGKFTGNCEPLIGAGRAKSVLAQAWKMGEGADLKTFYDWA